PDHVFSVAAVDVEARDLPIHAHGEVPAPALCADEAMSTMPADANALPWLPCCDVVADGIDASRDFMTWHTRIRQPRPETFFNKRVAVANAARFDFHAHLPSARLRHHTLDQFPLATRFADLCCLHGCNYSVSGGSFWEEQGEGVLMEVQSKLVEDPFQMGDHIHLPLLEGV